MPCTYDDYGEGERALHAKLSEVTRMLCAACKTAPAIISLVPGLPEWWRDHTEADRVREAREKARVRERDRAIVVQQAAAKAAIQYDEEHPE